MNSSTNFSTSTDPFENDPMFEDELFQQLLIGHQLDQVQSVEPLFTTPTPALFAPAPEPAGAGVRTTQDDMVSGDCSETNIKKSFSYNNKKKKHSVGAARIVEDRRSKMVNEKTKGNNNSITAVEVERQRRQNMSALHSSLRSLLPADYIKGKRSMSDHLHEAARYIKDMEGRIKELSIKRDELKSMKRSSSGGSSCSSNSCSSFQEYVTTVKACGEGGLIEIVAISTCCDLTLDIINGSDKYNTVNQPPPITLSKLLHFIGCLGLSVLNSVSSRVDNRLVHTIHAQVDDGRDIDPSVLQKQLSDHYNDSCVFTSTLPAGK